MKYFSLAILALVCASAVVSAAPSESVEELALKPFEGIKEKLKEYFEKFQCARNIIGKAVKGTDYQQDYEEFKKIVDNVMSDVKKCAGSGSKMEQLKCTFNTLKALPEYFTLFFDKLSQKNYQLVKDIKDQINNECFAIQLSLEDTFAPSFPEEFQCITDVLGEFSKANGMEQNWARTQPQMKQIIDNIKKCPEAKNKFFRLMCGIRETVSFFHEFLEYVKVVGTSDPKLLQQLVSQLNQKCAGVKSENVLFAEGDESSMYDKLKAVVEKIKCMSNAIGEAVKDTDFEGVFEEVKKDMEKVGDRMKACTHESSKVEAAKCMFNEIKRANEQIGKFLANLNGANRDAFNRAHKLIKEKCFA